MTNQEEAAQVAVTERNIRNVGDSNHYVFAVLVALRINNFDAAVFCCNIGN